MRNMAETGTEPDVLVQEHVVIGTCATIGVLGIVALILRFVMPLCRNKVKDSLLDQSSTSDDLASGSQTSSYSGMSSKSSSSSDFASSSGSRGSSDHSEWRGYSCDKPRSTSIYFSHSSRELLDSFSSGSGSTLSLPTLLSAQLRLEQLCEKDPVVGTGSRNNSHRGSLSSVSKRSDRHKLSGQHKHDACKVLYFKETPANDLQTSESMVE